ncbi:serine hydrolase domain-containing protein [Gryllotalpicola protaetiae]|uniref:Class A beta-lactamase-related serine hydrolase n=1 Tax=Gryllotalpicola protaetiae TaxID=2419771 RepID=A0A387BLV3_9MICO|nr:serine hydrolase domain-containing protein [Gryllotalpicola protaetiae]AYG03618.1 class A beta-lactamase-related serine hydrolase [Gryllotalpicola protaetiae]
MGWDAVARVAAERGHASSTIVMRGDDVVFEQLVGAAPNDLFYTFSVSKPFTALAIHLLAHRGQLDLDDSVADYWPEYAMNRKSSVTIRQVLAHRSGAPYSTGQAVGDAMQMADWQASVHAAENAHLRYQPGAVVAYGLLSFGFILGELVRRVDGRTIDRFIDDEFARPLGLADTQLGLMADAWERHVRLMAGRAVEHIRETAFNRRAVREAVIPAAGIQTTARDLARFYRVLLRGGDGIIPPDVVAGARELSADGELDHVIGHTMRWGTGFQLGFPGRVRPMGTHANESMFGHNGSGVCNVWADPVNDTVLVWLNSVILPRRSALAHISRLSDVVIEALAPTS